MFKIEFLAISAYNYTIRSLKEGHWFLTQSSEKSKLSECKQKKGYNTCQDKNEYNIKDKT